MLTAAQFETAAYVGDGEIICRSCAAKAHTALAVDRLDVGLHSSAAELSPVSRYELELGEYAAADDTAWIYRADGALAEWGDDDEHGPFTVGDEGDPFASYSDAEEHADLLAAPRCGDCDCEL